MPWRQVCEYRDGTTEIFAEAPHLSFTMWLSYLHSDFLAAVRRQSAEEERQKRRKEAGQL